VFENEPKISQGLLKHERALLLPHVGTLAYGTQQDMERFCLHNIMHALQTGKLKTFVSEQKGLF
jgi:D-3-phosphoglycerate dehydrogenase